MVPALGGPERKLAEVAAAPDPTSGWSANGSYLGWSPDSTHLLIMDRRVSEEPFGLFALSVQTREKRPLLKPLPTSLGDGNPAVSPDGHWLAFVRSPSYVVSDLYVAALSEKLTPAGEPVRLTFDNRRVNSPVWTPDGKEIIFTSDRNGNSSLWRISPDGRGGPRPVNLAGQFTGALSISWGPAMTAFRLAYVDARVCNAPRCGVIPGSRRQHFPRRCSRPNEAIGEYAVGTLYQFLNTGLAGAPILRYDFRQRQMLTFSRTEYPMCAVILLRDLDTHRVYRLLHQSPAHPARRGLLRSGQSHQHRQTLPRGRIDPTGHQTPQVFHCSRSC